ncbi:GspE/PulE family protein [Aestuariibius sp. 2305UL40-4]|uniref:GspE/PulE family protein n=1 Tax=Aestuariibius violaceus TaxID=3234132 RepID=UPI00345EAB40
MITNVDQSIVLARFEAEGLLDSFQRDRAIVAQRETGQPLRKVLDRLGHVSQKDWAAAASDIARLPLIELSEMPRPIPKVERLSADFLSRKAILPLGNRGNRPAFAIADPTDEEIFRVLRMAFGDAPALSIATDRDIEAARDAAGDEAPDIATETGDLDAQALTELANNAPTVTYIEALFARAVERSATDIHIESRDTGIGVRLRVDGLLAEVPPPARAIESGVLSRIKILAGMDISERRLPQDGRIRQRIGGRPIDMRASSLPSIHGETLVLRILDSASGLASLADLDMPPRIHDVFETALSQPNGLILMTGPTGSGKTTTLHAALSGINSADRKIVTIENPVEITAPGLVQIEVRPEIGMTFAAVLRTVLRHNPDILMVGEIRDSETAELAVRAAMTGHLVLSTLHTNSAEDAMQRMLDLGVPDFLLKSVLRMVAAQRLVRCLCPDCSEELPLGLAEADLVATLARLRPDLPQEEWELRRAKGCETCAGTGFSGRMAVFEALDETALLTDADTPSMADEALGLVYAGETAFQEVARVFGLAAFQPRGQGD